MASIKRRKVELFQVASYICEHPGDIAGMCVQCGQKLDSNDYLSRVSLRYIHNSFWVSKAFLLRLRANYSKELVRRKKLCLVLDLDHTLLNSSLLPYITSREEKNFKEAFPDSLYRIDHLERMIKLRPFVRTFLKEASDLFEMTVYTMGERCYALQMGKLLDPENIYFKSRIISRDDSTVKNCKSLDIVLAQENAVVILDDKKRVWEKQQQNLIKIGRYDYFASSAKRYGVDRKSFSEEKCDESETQGPLASVLEILKGVHALFFDEESQVNLEDRDVREVLKTFHDKIKLQQGN